LDSAHLYDDAAGIPEGHWSRLFYQHVYLSFDDSQFADLYEEGGRYPISPSLLACLTLLQGMFGVSDRAAVENTIMRRDWRIALGVESDYEGFDPSVLTRFRQRLRAGGMEREIFERTLGRIEELGLLSGRRRLRVDATHLVADVARLNRAEAVQEAIRLVVVEAYEAYPELRESLEFMLLYEAYGEERWIGGSRYDEERMLTLGRAGYQLLELLGDRSTKRKSILASLLAQHFVRSEGAVESRGGDDDPPAEAPIWTPHDPGVQCGKKRGQQWLGNKAHIVETADATDERPNVITDVLVTAPQREDSTVLWEVAGRARFRTPEVETLLADSGYASGANSAAAGELGIDLVAPPRANTQRGRGRYPPEAFAIDFEELVATCPAGQRSRRGIVRKRDIHFRFSEAACRACDRRSECTDSRAGRTLGISRHYEQLCRDRARARTEAFWNLYSRRAGIEATISKLVQCCGLRRSRYRGESGRALHAFMSAAALNVRRMLRWLATDAGPQQRSGRGVAVVSAFLPVAGCWLHPMAALCGALHRPMARSRDLARDRRPNSQPASAANP
jgi:transposase